MSRGLNDRNAALPREGDGSAKRPGQPDACRPLSFWCPPLRAVCASLQGQTNFAVLANDGVWTWFNDPRALFNNGTLYFSYDRFSDGKTVLSTLNLQTGGVTNLWTSSLAAQDDHNVAGLLPKQDGTMLAVYSRHGEDQFFCYRLSTSANPVSPVRLGSGTEKQHRHKCLYRHVLFQSLPARGGGRQNLQLRPLSELEPDNVYLHRRRLYVVRPPASH